MKCVLSSKFKSDIVEGIGVLILVLGLVIGTFIFINLIGMSISYIIGNVFGYWIPQAATSPFNYYMETGLVYFLILIFGTGFLVTIFFIIKSIIKGLQNYKKVINYIFDCEK